MKELRTEAQWQKLEAKFEKLVANGMKKAAALTHLGIPYGTWYNRQERRPKVAKGAKKDTGRFVSFVPEGENSTITLIAKNGVKVMVEKHDTEALKFAINVLGEE